MANIIKDFLGYLKLGEEEELDDFLEEEEEEPARKVADGRAAEKIEKR